MTSNRIAVYGHRGWASSKIVESLAASDAYLRVLYRPSSDTSTIPANVEKVEVVLTDQEALIASLKDIDIVISLVGHEGVILQHHFVNAIPKTSVRLFVPSNLAAQYDEQGNRIKVNREKIEVEEAAQKAGVPVTLVLPGNFAEFALSTAAMGIDSVGNKILFTGDSKNKSINLCTRDYVAAAYASIFASTNIDELTNRVIGLSELQPTGNDVARALTKKFGASPATGSVTLGLVSQQIDQFLDEGNPLALPYYCRKIWGTGQQTTMIGNDIWEVEGYPKANLTELMDGKLEQYRGIPPAVTTLLLAPFAHCT